MSYGAKTDIFLAHYESLAEISHFIAQMARAAGLDEDAIYSVGMAVDEACSNIIEHAYGPDWGKASALPAEIEVTCKDDLEAFTVILKDHGKPFDPASIPKPDIHQALEQRPIGGLGLFFIRQLMDDVHFEFQAGDGQHPNTNILTLTKLKKGSPTITYAAIKRRAEQLASVVEVSQAVISILDLDRLLDELVKLIPRRLGYRYVQIFTVHPGRRKIFYQAGNIPGSEELKKDEFSYDLDDPQGIIPWVARSGKTILANDVTQEPRYRHSEGLPAFQVCSEMTVPLIFGNTILGILDIQSDRLQAFGEDDLALCEAVAANIAVAMRNANLYHAEQWRRQVADGLREVAGLLSAEADVDHVLEVILTELERNLPCEAAAIWLTDEALPEGESPLLRLAAAHPPEVCLRLKEEAHPPGAWLEAALASELPIIRAPASESEPLGAMLGFPPDYSAISAPLRVGQQTLGVLTLAHHTANRYGSEARSITASFASYAAVAIENTRLFESARHQAWVATVLLQVAEATQTINDIPELLTTIARITPSLAGVNACAVWLFDPHDEVFHPVAADGLEVEQQIEFHMAHFAPGEQASFDQMRQENKPVVLDPCAGDTCDYALFRSPALVLFPMAAHGEVFGALLADFNEERPGRLAEAGPREDELAILQGIAHQAATAVENIRLVKSQREEAYISVALLQVAQAIVSLNHLDEILAAIVRITPMLVGVRRVAVFLWDESRGAFCLSQQYGFPREAEASFPAWLHPGDFPLLEVVTQGNTLAYAPIEDDDLSPLGWCRLRPVISQQRGEDHDHLSSSPHLGSQFDRTMLRITARLLYGFPLSVKGDILGVLVVEESYLEDDESPWHVRERRLEIVTGITQQLALAIQNEHLQREVVERERLERELQLARDIQRTFLPGELPKLPGWEIAARWRPARQVGGDFYDVFELPGNRLGIIIADVADKGIPAALFMTLIRTLVRAAVQQELSPAVVLERVNNLLVHDMRNGMFVTAAYAVLSWKTGELVYTNAGHNLPLLVRHPHRKVIRLPKCGMALGVETNIRLAEHRFRLKPGDCIVFYTDGVTEAFGPNERMFGEERLHRLIRSGQTTSASELLEAIDQSVDDFTEDEILSDDLTLVVLKREIR